MIASRADVEVRFDGGPGVNRATSGTLHRGRDRDFTSEHDSLLPGNARNLRADERNKTTQLSQVRRPPLDEKMVTVIIELGRRQPKPGLVAFNCKTRKYLVEEEKWKLLREEGRMWVFIRPRGGQDCYLLTCETRGDLEFCPIHRFDGMDQIPLH
jgi:hypothetical protein